ncbi:MAG: nucleotidyltransferase domain-containing protein [Candidatus Desantisbacteria bacterium]
MIKKISDKKVNYLIDHYLDKINEVYKPEEIWLWGSRVYGTPHEYSDIDMVVVSNGFAHVRFIKRRSTFIKAIGLLKDKNAEVVDALCYTPQEFERKKQEIGVIREAVEKGIRLV